MRCPAKESKLDSEGQREDSEDGSVPGGRGQHQEKHRRNTPPNFMYGISSCTVSEDTDEANFNVFSFFSVNSILGCFLVCFLCWHIFMMFTSLRHVLLSISFQLLDLMSRVLFPIRVLMLGTEPGNCGNDIGLSKVNWWLIFSVGAHLCLLVSDSVASGAWGGNLPLTHCSA